MKKADTKAKPKTKREAVATEIVAKTAKAAKTRKRQGNVRSLILEILASGPMTTSELVAKGKFSSAAAFMHLKALRADGAIEGARQGREVYYSLTGTAPVAASAASSEAAPKGARRRGRKAKAVKGSTNARPASLDSALESLTRRLAPIDSLDRKLSVLDQLAGSLPASVSSVLAAIRDDLRRIAG
jgi:DNA-binding transcriptional ArsR family regulator